MTFGVKLSNTLAMANHRGELPGEEMYMSGRALYPLTMNLFRKLTQEFNGDLNVSYSAGADALNAATILGCGACPITAASDLLKPGGYSRTLQWLENVEAEMGQQGAASLDETGSRPDGQPGGCGRRGAGEPSLQEELPSLWPAEGRVWAGSL